MNTPTPQQGQAKRAIAVVALAALSGLSACSASLLPKPPAAAARYTLDALTAAPSTLPNSTTATTTATSASAAIAANAPVLLVAQPSAAPGYDSVRMLYQRQPQQLEAFAFHEWVEPPARLLAPLMVRALQDTQAFRAVLLAPTSGTGSLRLETELTRLQQDFNAQPSSVRLTLRAVLIDTATRRVLASQVFDASAAAGRADPVAGVVVAQQLTQRVLGELAAACATWARSAQGAQTAQTAQALPGPAPR
jgi:cholesterol transport system auxiliary component